MYESHIYITYITTQIFLVCVFPQRTSLGVMAVQIFSGLEMQKHGTGCGKLVMMPGTLLWLSDLAAR